MGGRRYGGDSSGLFVLTETDEMKRGALEDSPSAREEQEEVLEETHMFLSVLEGFLMVLSTQGDMIFLSENVSQHMGLAQVNPDQRAWRNQEVFWFWSQRSNLLSSRRS